MPDAPAQAVTLRDRLLTWRDQLLASQRFQRWAAAFPMTRGIAERRTRELFDLCAGFVYTQVLAACVELDLFAILKHGPCDAAELARRLNLPLAAMTRLLRAAQSLQLVEGRSAGRVGLGPLGAALVGNPAIAAMVRHHRLFYDDLRNPVALLRGAQPSTGLGTFWPYAGATEPTAVSVAPYSALMAASLPLLVEDVLEAYSFAQHRCVLDVGGGLGGFVSAVLDRVPHLTGMLFDLPAVAESAGRQLPDALQDRLAIHGGSFLTDRLPGGADLITLVRVVHDHEDAAVRHLLRAAWAALPPGGVLLIAEPMAAADATDPVGDAYFGFYLAAMGSGRARPPETLAGLLAEAGFVAPKLRRTRRPVLVRVMTGQRPL
ncbi:methyltransferase [Dongia mobilis]|nr:methyltransferase [Dongia mobilis]